MSSRPNITGSFGATGQSASIHIKGKGNILISGSDTPVGNVQIEKSWDNSTWYPVSKDSSGATATYDMSSIVFNGTVDEPEDAVWYRLNCTAYTSGTFTYRISQ